MKRAKRLGRRYLRTLTDVIVSTIRMRSREVLASITRDNALLAQLQRKFNG